jgi:hypothetical protein
MGNNSGFNAAAFFGGLVPSAINSGAQAYAGEKRIKLEQEQQDWYKQFLEKNAEASRKQDDALQLFMMKQLGFDPRDPTGVAMKGAGMAGGAAPAMGTPGMSQQYPGNVFQGPGFSNLNSRSPTQDWAQYNQATPNYGAILGSPQRR